MAGSSLITDILKPPSEDVLDPMYPHGHIRGRQPRDFSDGHRVHIFQIGNDDLTVERLELLNQPRQPLQIDALMRVARIFFRKLFEFFQIHEILKRLPLPNHVRRGDMVRHAIDPRSQRTAGIERPKAPPQLKMNFLEQVAPFFRIHLVSAREPFERAAQLIRRVFVQVVLARLADQDELSSHTFKVVGGERTF